MKQFFINLTEPYNCSIKTYANGSQNSHLGPVLLNKLAQERNSKTAPMGGKISAGDNIPSAAQIEGLLEVLMDQVVQVKIPSRFLFSEAY